MSVQPTPTVTKIYGVPISVHTRKVILAARLKSIAYDVVPIVPVLPDSLPADWRSISPTGLIPAIDDDGYVLPDSTAILLYFEGKVSEPPLLPGAAKDYGRALFLDSWAGSALFRRIVQPLFHNQVVAPNIRRQPGDARAIQTALSDAAPEAFAYLESLAPESFLVGCALSIADLAVVSNLIMFHYLGYRLDAARYPMLRAYFQRHVASPTVMAVLEYEKPFVRQLGLDSKFGDDTARCA